MIWARRRKTDNPSSKCNKPFELNAIIENSTISAVSLITSNVRIQMLQFVPAGIAMLFYSPGLKPSFIRTKSSIQNLILRLFSAFELEDPVESIGAKLERQAASKSNDLAGDGTITSVVLVQGLIAEGVKVLATGANPVQITRGIEKSVKALVAELKLMSKEVEDSELADVGAVTAGNNNEIGSMIAEAMGKVGRKGVVTLEEGKSSENNVYVVEGMQFDRSYIFPYFITDSEKMAVEYDNCKLLLVDMKILNARDLVSVLEDAIRGGYPILVIAEDIEAEALAPFVVNKLRGSFKIAVVKAPGFGERKSQYLDDIAILTAATVIRVSLDKAENEVLGHAAKVVLNKETTTIVGDGSTQDAVNKRVAQIRNLIEAADQDYEKEKLNERIAKLLGGAAVIQAKRMDVVWGETTGVEGNCCFCHPYYSHCRGLKHTSGSCYYSKLH